MRANLLPCDINAVNLHVVVTEAVASSDKPSLRTAFKHAAGPVAGLDALDCRGVTASDKDKLLLRGIGLFFNIFQVVKNADAALSNPDDDCCVAQGVPAEAI